MPGADRALDAEVWKRSNPRWVFAQAEAEPREAGPLNGDLLACALNVWRVATPPTTTFVFPLPFPVTESDVGADDVKLVFGFGSFASRGGGAPKTASHSTPRFKADDRPSITVRGADKGHTLWFTAPAVRLAPGEPVTVEIHDTRLFSSHTRLLTLRAAYEGRLPLRMSGNGAAAECRLVPRSERDARIRLGLRAADAETARLDTEQVPTVLDMDHMYYRLTELLRFTAAQVGWADPRLRIRMNRFAQVHRRLVEEQEAAQVARQAALPPPETWIDVVPGAIAARVVSTSCGPAAANALSAVAPACPDRACLLRVRLRNTGTATTTLRAYNSKVAGVDWELADRFGRSVSLYTCRVVGDGDTPRDGPVDLPPGAESEVIFGVDRTTNVGLTPYFSDYPPALQGDLAAARPLLLRGSDAEKPQAQGRWLRVE
ncbi:Hypothetical protein A7982_01209 [Minicystis rosea]|nr:Hypothetical protein A7982_01209 [Minicystis rosea]